MNNKSNILILVPDLKKPGGVANYYTSLQKYWEESVTYFTRGTRLNSGKIGWFVTSLIDYCKFIFRIIFSRPNIILINSSFGLPGLLRDSIFMVISRIFAIKYIIFFRGWEKEFERKLDKNLLSILFKITFIRAKKIIVLARDFQNFIESRKFKGEIIIETTTVDDSALINYNVDKFIASKKLSLSINLLFLSRVEKTKGIYETIEIANSLVQDGFNVKLYIAGDGNIMQEVKNYTQLKSMYFVKYLGYINGNEKCQAYINADFYIFPSTFGEGMPNSVLEAMSFGLPILVNSVGGIPDFFTSEMGLMTNKPTPIEYINFIKYLVQTPKSYEKISRFNHQYAVDHFLASKVSERILNILS